MADILKIAVYAIAKNEAQFVERFCKSAEDADYVVIADTGSTDDTVELAWQHGALVHEISISPWRFDKARDTALALVPKDVDICISLDLDEVLEPGWREEIERVWTPETTRLRYKFDWGAGISFWYEKIHARYGYHWHHPVHEYPRPDGRITEVYAHTDKLLVSHHPDPTKSRGQYLPLLELSVKEDPACPRNAFYYARELTFYGRWIDAIVALNKYLDNPQATWMNERCYAMRLLGSAYRHLGDNSQAQVWLERACNEAPNTREPWVELADLANVTQQWALAIESLEKAFAITDKALVYTMDPSVWGARPHDLMALACFYSGRYDDAVRHGSIACELEPDNARYKSNFSFYQQKVAA
jgi:tetratricopeptide (TPR) repeat protein